MSYDIYTGPYRYSGIASVEVQGSSSQDAELEEAKQARLQEQALLGEIEMLKTEIQRLQFQIRDQQLEIARLLIIISRTDTDTSKRNSL